MDQIYHDVAKQQACFLQAYRFLKDRMCVKEHPRLVNQKPRGSKRYNQIKKIRSASERSNSTIKEDKKTINQTY